MPRGPLASIFTNYCISVDKYFPQLLLHLCRKILNNYVTSQALVNDKNSSNYNLIGGGIQLTLLQTIANSKQHSRPIYNSLQLCCIWSYTIHFWYVIKLTNSVSTSWISSHWSCLLLFLLLCNHDLGPCDSFHNKTCKIIFTNNHLFNWQRTSRDTLWA